MPKTLTEQVANALEDRGFENSPPAAAHLMRSMQKMGLVVVYREDIAAVLKLINGGELTAREWDNARRLEARYNNPLAQ